MTKQTLHNNAELFVIRYNIKPNQSPAQLTSAQNDSRHFKSLMIFGNFWPSILVKNVALLCNYV
jgi:hypothetical protein